jgi:4-hydroxy-tetrahydrodipicolinate reductase
MALFILGPHCYDPPSREEVLDMKLAIAGAGGRMGRVLTRIVNETPGAEVAGGIETKGSQYAGADMGELAGLGPLGVTITDDPLKLLTEVEGVIDFTVPAASVALAELTAQARLVHVIGTTGIGEDGEAKIRAASRHARIIKSGNMSLGVNLLAALVRKVAASLGEEFDIEVLEMHHRHKIDAPSGTALLLGQAAASGRNLDLKTRSVRSRDGHTGARPEGDIGFATLRGGSVVGEHTVMFAGPAERIELTHKAESRDIFARGAVKAALWGMDKKPGLYSMTDVLGLE